MEGGLLANRGIRWSCRAACLKQSGHTDRGPAADARTARAKSIKRTGHMTQISKRGPVKSAARWAVPLAIVGLLSTPMSPGFWTGSAWGKDRREPPNAPVTVQPTAPDPAPAALPLREPTAGALGTALASCDKGSESSESLTLPGARGEVKLDRCYRGRDHLVCSLNALKPDNLAADLQNAGDFTSRFKALKAEYDARTNCANKIGQSLRDVTLPDMAQAPGILKSMIDSVEGDVKGVSVVQAKVVELAEKIDSSQKAMVTIRKIHRTMCLRDQHAVSQAEDRASR